MNNTNPLIVEESSDKENIFMKPLFALKEIIFNLNQGNIENSVQQTLNLIDTNFPYSFNLSISILVFAAFYAQRNDADISLCYLQSIQNMGEMDENYNILRVFSDYISKINIQEGYYLIEKMIQRKLIGINIIKNIPTKYFAHYKTEKENRIIDIYTYDQTFFENYEELSKNNWELHKKLIEEGNPNEIAQIIRNDEIEKLQEISSQNGFEFSQFIKSSLYERYDFVHFDTSLIDYAAFFRSVKCFKFLLFHGSQIGNAGKYAVAGGNEEIIHLCEQNHSTFFGAYEAAIKFHRNDIFYYIYKKNWVLWIHFHSLEDLQNTNF